MELIFKFFRFGVVGFSGVIIDFSLTYFFKEKVKVQKFVANAIGFIVAASSNYFLNRIWTFKSNNPEMAAEITDFFLVSLIGLSINSLVLWMLNNKYNLPFYFAKFVAIIVTTFWNFIANYLYTFAA